jgi:Ca2+/Na+ antiporter
MYGIYVYFTNREDFANDDLKPLVLLMFYAMLWSCLLALLYTCSFLAYVGFFIFLCMYGIFDTKKKKEYETWIKEKEQEENLQIKFNQDFSAKFLDKINRTKSIDSA